jgi:hypothetical protein
MANEDKDEASSERKRASERRAETSRELEEVKSDLTSLVVQHPVGALAAALGVGYVVGGGVFTRLTSRLLRLGLRLGIQLAVVPLLEQEAASLVGLGEPPARTAAPEGPAKGRAHH